jgi:hypothetical protein
MKKPFQKSIYFVPPWLILGRAFPCEADFFRRDNENN